MAFLTFPDRIRTDQSNLLPFKQDRFTQGGEFKTVKILVIDVHDPWVDAVDARKEYGIELCHAPQADHYDASILAVGHNRFTSLGPHGIRTYGKSQHVLYDVKSLFAREDVDARL